MHTILMYNDNKSMDEILEACDKVWKVVESRKGLQDQEDHPKANGVVEWWLRSSTELYE